jgi:hypothetical protein
MKAVELQVSDKGVKIFRDGAGLRAGVRIRGAAAPSAPIESDDPISCFDEAPDVVLKAIGIPRVGMKQHDRNTVAAAVLVPQAHAGQLCMSGELCSRCHNQ